MPLDYSYEKLRVAVDALLGQEPIQSRLEIATIGVLSELWPAQDGDIPADVLANWKAIEAALTDSQPVADEGLIKAAINRMDDETAERIARSVFVVFRGVSRAYAADLMKRALNELVSRNCFEDMI